MIGRLIGVSGSNVSELKNMINHVEGVEEYPGIYIEEQESRLPSGSFRNMGERNSPENIILRITLKGSPDFENIHKIIQEYQNYWYAFPPHLCLFACILVPV